MKTIPENLMPLERLRTILRMLRAPDGCPWDKEQTIQTLKPCLQEEVYELLDAMETDDVNNHREELGDVLLQVLFQTAIREEEHAFTLDDVINTLSDKLIRRHPHIFADVDAKTEEQVMANWEQIKKLERKDAAKTSTLDGVPDALPALLKAQRIQGKASHVGFDWKDASGPQGKVQEELLELDEAIATGDQAKIEDEMGDVLFSLVNLCRFLKVDAESSLRGSINKFSGRFKAVECEVAKRNLNMKDLSLEELDLIWDVVKRHAKM